MREPYRFIPEVLWKMDDVIEATRKLPGWREFHKACGKAQLYFDHPEKRGRLYVVVAVQGSGTAYKVAEETGKTPIEATAAAFRASNVSVAEAVPWLEMALRGNAPAEAIDLDDILG